MPFHFDRERLGDKFRILNLNQEVIAAPDWTVSK